MNFNSWTNYTKMRKWRQRRVGKRGVRVVIYVLVTGLDESLGQQYVKILLLVLYCVLNQILSGFFFSLHRI